MKGKIKKTDEKNSNDKVKDALYKKAVGYDATEVVEEYSESDGELILTKKKITTKNVPPDISAIKIVLGLGGDETDLAYLSDEELEKQKNLLIKKIREDADADKKEKAAT